MQRSLGIRVCAALAWMSLTATTAAAQSPIDSRSWLQRSDWRWLGAFAIAAAAATPFDTRLAHQFRRPSVQRNAGLSRTAAAFRASGDPGAVLSSLGVLAVGEISRNAAWADVGLHTSEAVLLSGFTSGVIKGIVGRARPYTVQDSNAFVLRPFSRRAGYTSFPSGHTTVAFAAASALSAEWRKSELATRHPTVSGLVTPALFGAASAVGLSRMYHDAHWASDVIVAAGIGTVTGRIMVRAQHGARRDRVDRWLLPSTVAPSPNGIQLGWHATW